MKWRSVLKEYMPPLWVILVLIALSVFSLVYVFIKRLNLTLTGYSAYFISAYTVAISSVFAAVNFEEYYHNIRALICRIPLGKRYLTDVAFRVKVSLYTSVFFNFIYSVFKFVTGLIYRSLWWGAVAVYYMLLSSVRFILLRHIDNDDGDMLDELKKYRLCGVLLAATNVFLSAMVCRMIVYQRFLLYSDLVIVSSAIYTFYNVSLALIEIVHYRKYNSPVFSAAKKLRLVTALVSLLSFETAILSVYVADENLRTLIKGITGAAICVAVLCLSVFMIVSSTRKIEKSSCPENKQGKK